RQPETATAHQRQEGEAQACDHRMNGNDEQEPARPGQGFVRVATVVDCERERQDGGANQQGGQYGPGDHHYDSADDHMGASPKTGDGAEYENCAEQEESHKGSKEDTSHDIHDEAPSSKR